MEGIIKAASNGTSVRAILVGGPASLPEISRIQTVSPLSDKIKVAHQGGYEHFERRTEPDEPALSHAALSEAIEFYWTMRTKAAE
jgi:Family of unknown function (DUF5988)